MFSDRTNWKLTLNLFSETQDRLRAAGTPFLDLTVSNPTQCGLPYDTEAVLAAFQNPAMLNYQPQPKGSPLARKAVTSYYRDSHAVSGLDPEHILLTTSTSEAYSFVFRLLCNPGDEVLVPAPSYPLFDFLADLHDVKLVPYALTYAQKWLVDFRSLTEAVSSRTRAILLVHPNNPTGSFVAASELERLNLFCREKHLALLADEVFLDYPHDALPRRSFVANQEVLTFTLSGLSKISALPQMKAAWVVTTGPKGEVAAALDRLEIISDTFLSLNAPIQYALPALLEQRKIIQPFLMVRIQENIRELHRQLEAQSSCELLHADGGWCAVLRVPSTQCDEDLVIDLLQKQNVLVHPGHFYDFSEDGHLILSLITPSAIFREGIRKLLKYFTS